MMIMKATPAAICMNLIRVCNMAIPVLNSIDIIHKNVTEIIINDIAIYF
ncbi:MAG: hypothetical protein H6573_34330 [Lewinellaceae bacterium]|nr:hypothetical protein [Lewinellaceae bacterium]